MAVSVRKLIQRGEARHVVRDRVALEDALNTTLSDDGRLVLVRRLQVRGDLADPARRQYAVRRGWVEAVAGAVHGGKSAANRANCVWFASREEAEALLLRKLLTGEPIEGWFWRLAVPDWGLRPLTDWAPRAVAASLAEKDVGRLACIVQTFVEAGRADLLVAAVGHALAAPDGPFADTIPRQALSSGRATLSASSDVDDEALAVRIAVKMLPQALPAAWRAVLADLGQTSLPGGACERVIAAVVEERIRQISPALTLRPRLLKLVASKAREIVAGGSAAPEQAAGGPSGAQSGAAPRWDVVTCCGTRQRASAMARAERRDARLGEARARSESPLPPEIDLADPAKPHLLPTSDHAGLWLIVPSLIRLGFGEWLAERAELLGDNPGRSLILAVARHHRIGPDDPALAPLAPVASDEDLPGWTDAWRIGLDRWLRRTARRRTHDLVRRPGKFALGEHRIDIHFPLDAADLRLRRPALDRDPGWVAWMGLSVRYHFGAEAVP